MALSQWKEAILEGIFMEIKEGVVMVKNLERLENLVEILHREGSKVPESVKDAYCQVAVHSTAKCLGYGRDARVVFMDAMRLIWLRRVMPLCDKVSCLVTRDLLDSCRRVWTAHFDAKACKTLMDENTKEKALVSLRKVVSELHPNIDCAYDDRNEDESIESDPSDESGETEIEINQNSEAPEAMDEDQDTELERQTSGESKAESSPTQIKTIPSAVRKLRFSKTELVTPSKEGGPSKLNKETVTKQENDVATPSATNTAPRRSLMERKSTAHTFEWEDSIDDSDEEMSSNGQSINKLKRKKIVVSPLKRNQSSKCSRRMHVPWTTAETMAVMKGHEMYGADWKRIREENPVLVRRTNGDLKDKYRVEMRREERHP